MQLDDYFETLSSTDIRIKGTRVGIETILLDYLDFGLFPEGIALRYPTLTIEQVYATITYYWHNQDEVDTYLKSWKEHGIAMRANQEKNPPTAIQRLRLLVAQQETQAQSGLEAAVA